MYVATLGATRTGALELLPHLLWDMCVTVVPAPSDASSRARAKLQFNRENQPCK